MQKPWRWRYSILRFAATALIIASCLRISLILASAVAAPGTKNLYKSNPIGATRERSNEPPNATISTTRQEHESGPSTDVPFVPLTKDFLEMLGDPDRYNRYATPTQYQQMATNVSMSMYIEGISSFSAQTMDYHLDVYFYQEWLDSRLAHNSTGPILIRDKTIFNKLWHPDVYFANARMASFQEITEDNFLVWVYPDGRVWYDCRISLVAICMMNLWKYPLDSQVCELRILSYAYPESQLRLRWSETLDPISANPDIRMPDMRLVDIKTGSCNGTYATGIWSCMTAVFHVQREMLHHIVQTYVPTALIVVISWFNFWLDIDSAPARVSLSITTLLTIATQANAVKLSLPEVSYMKAIDVWMGMCMSFVFAVMVEYTIAHYAKNQEMLHRPPNLLVDSTLSTLLGTTAVGGNLFPPGRQGRGTPTQNAQNAVLHTRTSTKRAAGAKFSLQPDGSELHSTRLRAGSHIPATCGYVGNSELDETGEESEEEESEELFEECYETGPGLSPPIVTSPASGLIPQYTKLPHKGSGLLFKYDSFAAGGSGDAARVARLRIPLDMNEDEQQAVALEARRPKISAIRLRKQVIRRAQAMREKFHRLRGRSIANKIDQKSRIIFPASFILVNIAYWSFYLIFN